MKFLPKLFENNRAWAEQRKLEDPQYFERLSRTQTPEYLWIGCADSRVPANEIVVSDPASFLSTAISPTSRRLWTPMFSPCCSTLWKL